MKWLKMSIFYVLVACRESAFSTKGWGSRLLQNNSKICIRLLCVFFQRNQKSVTLLFNHQLLEPALWNLWRYRRLKPFFFFPTNKKLGTLRSFYTFKILPDFSTVFSLILFNPEGNRGGTRKGIKFWTERFSGSPAGELGF